MAHADDLHTRFPRGCRVCLDRGALAAAGVRLAPPLEGTVVGYSRKGDRLWLLLDGRTSRQCYPVQCVRRLTPEEA